MVCRLVTRVYVGTLLCLLLIACGCGDANSNLAEVKGKVLIDGKPLTSGSVTTLPARGPGASGTINELGEFTLRTREKGPGASLGVHHVGVAAFEESSNWSPEAPRKSIIPQRYSMPETSGLTIDVKADEPNEVVLELTSKP